MAKHRRYQLVIFDWEGTLGDTLGQILDCVAVEAKRLQFGEFDEAQARLWVDLGLNKACRKIFPQLSTSQHQELLCAVENALRFRHGSDHLFKGAKELVQHLADEGYDLAIATNKGHNSLQRALQTTGLDHYFKVTRSAGQVPPKPCPQMLEEILDRFAVSATQAVMIGDSESDMKMAKSIAMDAIGVNFYHNDPANLLASGANAVFNDYQMISEYLDSL